MHRLFRRRAYVSFSLLFFLGGGRGSEAGGGIERGDGESMKSKTECEEECRGKRGVQRLGIGGTGEGESIGRREWNHRPLQRLTVTRDP